MVVEKRGRRKEREGREEKDISLLVITSPHCELMKKP